MRDPNRIYSFCYQLAEIWKTNCPDWRFGQFISNVFGSFDKDPWYFEEDEMIKKITGFFSKEV